MKALMVFLALSIAGVDSAAAQSPAEVVAAFHAALAAGDSTRALDLLAPEVVIYEGGGIERSREEYRSHHLGADIASSTGTQRAVAQQVSDLAGELAWVISTAAVLKR